jgi:hypothetical protein
MTGTHRLASRARNLALACVAAVVLCLIARATLFDDQLDGTAIDDDSIASLLARLRSESDRGTLSAAAIVRNGTLVCALALMNAFGDDRIAALEACPLPLVVHALGGAALVARVLPSRCRDSAAWRQLPLPASVAVTPRCLAKLRVATNADAGRADATVEAALQRLIDGAGIGSAGDDDAHEAAALSAADAEAHRWLAAVRKAIAPRCGRLLPIAIGVPRGFVRRRALPVARRLFGFMPLLPGPHPHAHGPYVLDTLHDEWLLRALYERSLFAFTHNRGGWDSFRHYEILAAGAVPYFADLRVAPTYAVPHLPRALLDLPLSGAVAAVRHVGLVTGATHPLDPERFPYFYREGEAHINFRRPGTVRADVLDAAQLESLADALLAFTRARLTTDVVARYVVAGATATAEASASGARRRASGACLVVSDFAYDYVTLTMLHGLASCGDVDDGGGCASVTFVGKNLSAALFAFDRRVVNSVGDMERERSRAFTGCYGGCFGHTHRVRRACRGRVRFVPTRREDPDVLAGIARGDFRVGIFTYVAPEAAVPVATQRLAAMGDAERQEALLARLHPYYAALRQARVPTAFVDGTDAEVVPARVVRALTSMPNTTVFVRELTEEHCT